MTRLRDLKAEADALLSQKAGKIRPFWTRWWGGLWRGKPPGLGLVLLAGAVTMVMLLPILYVLSRGLEAGIDRWVFLVYTRVPALMWQTLGLTAMVTLLATGLGVTLAWLVVRTDLPGRQWWQWLLALGLVVPPYIGALSYIILLGPRGWFQSWLGFQPFPIYGFWGTTLVLTLFTYPYVYLLSGAALRRFNLELEEAALSCGLSYKEVFRRVTLPLLRPALGAGAILVALYVLSDFGAVTLLRYNTFTSSIYFQLTGRLDRSGAAVLSIVLILVTLAVLWWEEKGKKKRHFYQTGDSFRPPQRISLGRWRMAALALVGTVFFLALILPVMVLVYWTVRGLALGDVGQGFWNYAGNSFLVSGLAALICGVLALPVAYLRSRHPSRISQVMGRIAYGGYALPGVIVALGVVFIYNQYLPSLYSTIAMMITAYTLRFLPQSLQAADASLAQVSPRLDEAARSLGKTPGQVVRQVLLPLVMPGILAGAALVFVSALKELPATLLLRPPGFDTLAVRVWMEAHEGFYNRAAPPALLLILVSLLPLRWMISKY